MPRTVSVIMAFKWDKTRKLKQKNIICVIQSFLFNSYQILQKLNQSTSLLVLQNYTILPLIATPIFHGSEHHALVLCVQYGFAHAEVYVPLLKTQTHKNTLSRIHKLNFLTVTVNTHVDTYPLMHTHTNYTYCMHTQTVTPSPK